MAAEDDVFTFFSSLSPEDQQQFLMNFGAPQQQEEAFYQDMPQELDGLGAPQQDPTSMMLSLLASGAMPQYTAKGAVEPFDLQQASQRLNYTQDIGGSMFDNAVALFAGPDAFGSMSQFAPITKYTGQAVPAQVGDDGLPRPVTKSQKMLEIAKRSGGARGFLADLIDQGTDPEAAVAALRDLVSKSASATNLAPEQRKQIDDIRNTLDVWRTNDPLTGAPKPVDRKTAGWEQFDEDSLRKTAQDMFEQKLSDEMDSSTLEFDPESGKYYQGKVTEDSPSAKKFRDAGLPLPTEQYTDPARIQAMMQSVDPSGFDRREGQAQQASQAETDLEEQRQKLLASQLDLQGYDQRLREISQPGAAPSARPSQQNPTTFTLGGPVPPPAAQISLPPGFSSATDPNAPTVQGSAAQAPLRFSTATQPNAPTLQGVDQRGQPAVQMPRTVTDSFGNPRSVTPQNFDFGLTQQIFGNIPQTGAGVKTSQRLQQRDAVGQRQKNQAADQAWRDQYNRNYSNTVGRKSTADESNADMLAGMMRARARQTTPLQDTMLARLLSLKSRAGI